MKNISDCINHGVLHDVVSGSSVFFRRADDVDAAAGDIAADADALALPVDDGVVRRRNEFQDSIPRWTGPELKPMWTHDLHFVHATHVDVDTTCKKILNL